MGTKIHSLLYFYTNICITALCDVRDAVDASEPAVKAIEFICFFSTLETKSLKEREICLFCNGRDCEGAGTHNHIMGIVLLADGNRDLIWFSCSLDGCVYDTSIVFSVLICGQDKEPICKFIHCFFVHSISPPYRILPFLSNCKQRRN